MKKYISTFIIVFIVVFIGIEIYTQVTKEKVSSKAKRLPCQAKVTSFERMYDIKELQKTRELLQTGNYIIKSGIDKSKYMESTLFNFVNIDLITSKLQNKLEKLVINKNITDDKITISYKIYENDVDDPKKKSDNCKLFRGYVVLKVLNQNNKNIYQAQIDFMDREGKDISSTLDCAMESFLTYK